MENTFRLKREELYEMVWAEPVTILAKRYGLSDVGFAKICRKLKVPIPGRGYWQRKGLEKKPPLLSTNGPVEHVIHVKKPDETKVSIVQSSEAQAKIGFERQPENQLKVTPILQAHPLVSHIEKSLKKCKPDEFGRISAHVEGGLGIVIYPSSIDRAMCILDALIKGLQARGYAVSKKGRLDISVMNEDIVIGLEEHSKRIDHKLTDLEKKELIKYPWMSVHKYDHLPSGELSLIIKTSLECTNGIQKLWSDGKRKLEDCLNAFVIGLIKFSEAATLDRIEAERRELERQEEERKWREIERQRWEERERITALEREAEAWHKSQKIRAYLEAVKEYAVKKCGVIQPGSDIDRWLFWANKYADRLDPLIETKTD